MHYKDQTIYHMKNLRASLIRRKSYDFTVDNNNEQKNSLHFQDLFEAQRIEQYNSLFKRTY